MPLTPMHGLAVFFLYFKAKNKIDPLALIASAIVIYLKPLYYTLIGEPLDHRCGMDTPSHRLFTQF